MVCSGSLPERGQPGHSREQGIVTRRDFPTPGEPARKPAKLAAAEDSLEIRQAIIVSEIDHVIGMRHALLTLAVIRDDAVVAETACGRGASGVGKRHNSSFS